MSALGVTTQKLSRPDPGRPDAHPNLQAILTKSIDWELVRQQYDQMVKYVTAVRLGTAETESILRRFVRIRPTKPSPNSARRSRHRFSNDFGQYGFFATSSRV